MKVLNWILNWFRSKFNGSTELSASEDCSKIHFFGLVAIYLRDHGYYERLHRNNQLMVVFGNWFKYKMSNRGNALAFRVGDPWHSNDGLKDNIYCFEVTPLGKNYAPLHQDWLFADRFYGLPSLPILIGNINDPFCIDAIMSKVEEYYG